MKWIKNLFADDSFKNLWRMKRIFSFALIFCLLAGANLRAEPWGQPDTEDKIDPNPWMWKLRGSGYETPEALATAIKEKSGVWKAVFSRLNTDATDPEWDSFDNPPHFANEFESEMLWRNEELAIVYAYASAFRKEMCAIWILLRFDELNNNWQVQDFLMRRDIGYSHVETRVFENVKEVPGPILFIDTYRGGRRSGEQSYELYRIENYPSPAGAKDALSERPPLFRRCLNVRTLYEQQYRWRGEATFSIASDSEISVRMLRGNYGLDEEVQSEIQLEWLPDQKQFDSGPIEAFIGIEKLEEEDRKTEGMMEDER